METWLILIILFITLGISLVFYLFSNYKLSGKLPPGPMTIPGIGNIFWLRKTLRDLEPFLTDLKSKHGPVITVRIGPKRVILITDRFLAYEALIQRGSIFADRPPAVGTEKITSSNQHQITTGAYGPTWRLLRRNLTAEILHPSRVRAYSGARRWVVGDLIERLKWCSESGEGVAVYNHLNFAVHCLLAFMCFGDKLDEDRIREIESVQRKYLVNFGRFGFLNYWPRLSKILFRKKWDEFLQTRGNQEKVLIPLIKARIIAKQKREMERNSNEKHEVAPAYVDTFLNLELPDEKRKLRDDEMVSLCSEFLNAGIDSTTTSLQWIIANLVKYQQIQKKLYQEINTVVQEKSNREIEEDDLQKMPYLKAVVLEALRRHPPVHFVLPHAVTEDVILNGFLIPKTATITFTVAEMGWDPQVWEDPMVFKPERFMGHDADDFDITGSREIKMMPFGAGRRICPGLELAMLHLQYFVANLIWCFQWTPVDGDDVDLSERVVFTVVMKKPLRAHLTPRFK